MTNKFDYIIAGGGCAGLMLALKLNESQLRNKSVLIIDKDVKTKNDRTWCFWEKTDNQLEQIVYKTWSIAKFYGKGFNEAMDITPYKYKMIRGIDFYNHVNKSLATNNNITRLQATIENVNTRGQVTTNIGVFEADLVFNSYYLQDQLSLPNTSFNILQHFKGWRIKTDVDAFDPEKMTYMDFRVARQNDTRFCYVLPFTKTEALVEYTLFTEKLLSPEMYDSELKAYIKNQLQIDNYEIKEEEFGIIPMTDYRFSRQKSNKVINIGTLGGHTKASTGFTFLRIQKAVDKIVANMINGKHPTPRYSGWTKRFKLYDSILLNVLANESYPIKDVFTELFAKNGPNQVFKFLDEETSLWEEIKIMNLTPKKEFIKAFFQQIVKLNRI